MVVIFCVKSDGVGELGRRWILDVTCDYIKVRGSGNFNCTPLRQFEVGNVMLYRCVPLAPWLKTSADITTFCIRYFTLNYQ